MASSSEENEESEEYEVTSPIPGFLYHREIISYILVRLMKRGERFQLSPERKVARPFDDVVFEYGPDDRKILRLMQCKHKESGSLEKKHLESIGKKSPFNLSKYMKSYDDIKQNLPGIHDLIMSTNAQCNLDDIITRSDDDFLMMKVCNLTPDYYKKSFREMPETTNSDFFEKLKFWFTRSTEEMKGMTTDELKKEFDSDVPLFFLTYLNKIVEERFSKRYAHPITHECLVELRKEVTKKHIGDMQFETDAQASDFYGMEEALTYLRNAELNNIVVVRGPEGAGKTQLARKFASEKPFKHCIWINAVSRESIRESFGRLAFQKLRISFTDLQGRPKDAETIVEEVCSYFEEERVLFVFDGAEEEVVLHPSFESHFVLITTREDILRNASRVNLSGFTREEAIYYIQNKLHDESREDASWLAEFCQLNPKKIHNCVEKIEKMKIARKIVNEDYTISELLATSLHVA